MTRLSKTVPRLWRGQTCKPNLRRAAHSASGRFYSARAQRVDSGAGLVRTESSGIRPPFPVSNRKRGRSNGGKPIPIPDRMAKHSPSPPEPLPRHPLLRCRRRNSHCDCLFPRQPGSDASARSRLIAFARTARVHIGNGGTQAPPKFSLRPTSIRIGNPIRSPHCPKSSCPTRRAARGEPNGDHRSPHFSVPTQPPSATR